MDLVNEMIQKARSAEVDYWRSSWKEEHTETLRKVHEIEKLKNQIKSVIIDLEWYAEEYIEVLPDIKVLEEVITKLDQMGGADNE